MRSPTRIVGCMEPDGTSFQSAKEERMEQSTTARMRRGRISRRHQRRARERRAAFFMRGLTGKGEIRSMKRTAYPFHEPFTITAKRGRPLTPTLSPDGGEGVVVP